MVDRNNGKDGSKRKYDSGEYVFRRFRRDPRTGRVLDARWYGLKAWKIPVKPDRQPG